MKIYEAITRDDLYTVNQYVKIKQLAPVLWRTTSVDELLSQGYTTHDLMVLLSIAGMPFDATIPIHKNIWNTKPKLSETTKWYGGNSFYYNLHPSMYEASQQGPYAPDWDIYFGIFHCFFQQPHLIYILQKYPDTKIKEYGIYQDMVFFKNEWMQTSPPNAHFLPAEPVILEMFQEKGRVDLYQLWTMMYRESHEIPLFVE